MTLGRVIAMFEANEMQMRKTFFINPISVFLLLLTFMEDQIFKQSSICFDL